MGMTDRKHLDHITHEIIGAAIAVHDTFGPGLFEKTYIPPLMWELHDRGLRCLARVPLDLEYRGRRIANAYVIDVLVEDLVVVEVKSVQQILPVHIAQAITYVRLAEKPAGVLINFNVKRMVDGIRRVANEHPTKTNTHVVRAILAEPEKPDSAL